MGALKKKCALMCSPPRCMWFMWIKWNMCWEHGRKHSLIQVCIGQYINGTKPYRYFNEYQSSSRASKISQFIGPHQQIISNYQLTPLKTFFPYLSHFYSLVILSKHSLADSSSLTLFHFQATKSPVLGDFIW